MSTAPSPATEHAEAALSQVDLDAGMAPVDTCWNRIGVRGDNSCPELARVVRCMNCQVFASAATQLLDRVPSNPGALLGHGGMAGSLAPLAAATSFLMFRLGEEWLGVPTQLVREVAPMRRLHPVPHRRHSAALGLVNIRGRLMLCLSLERVLGIAITTSAPALFEADPAPGAGPTRQRLLVIGHDGLSSVFPVDEVLAVEQIEAAAQAPVPASLGPASAHFSAATTVWRERTVGLLDGERLFTAFTRSLA